VSLAPARVIERLGPLPERMKAGFLGCVDDVAPRRLGESDQDPGGGGKKASQGSQEPGSGIALARWKLTYSLRELGMEPLWMAIRLPPG
jgi:hypothetical protein